MKKFQKWMGILLISFAASSLVVACGDDEDASCLTDDDCLAEELCNLTSETCGIDCTTDPTVCLDDETCSPAADTGSVCVIDGTTEPECTTNEDCTVEGETCTAAGVCADESVTGECSTTDDCEGDDICVDSVCEVPATDIYFFAQLVDTTTDADACDASDPGSDIFGFMLEKGSDQSLAYGFAINAVIENGTSTDNTNNDYDSVLDGSAPGFTGACADFENTFSLGCGGNVVVKFINGAGATVAIEDGDTITPMEYGGQCSGGDDLDRWSVSVCASGVSEDDLTGNTGACNGIAQGDGSGESPVTVDLSM